MMTQYSNHDIIEKAQAAGLDLSLLYEAVLDLSSGGMTTANCINQAAGILLGDLGLPQYFFKHIRKESLVELLRAIASDMKEAEGKLVLRGQVAPIDFGTDDSDNRQSVRIATGETRDAMESLLEEIVAAHRREYYYSPENDYYTYIISPEAIKDFPAETFAASPFLFSINKEDDAFPSATRKRYENFLAKSKKEVIPLTQFFNLPDTGETRIMFKCDSEKPQLPALRKIFTNRGYTILRAYWVPYLSSTPELNTSVCSLYIKEELTRREEEQIRADLQNFLAFSQGPLIDLFINGTLTLDELIVSGNAIDFTHLFIYKELENATDREILANLVNKDQRESFARRIQDSNRSTYSTTTVKRLARSNPDLLKELARIFDSRFNPESTHISAEELEREWLEWDRKITARFMDCPIGYDIFRFMFKYVSCCLKTNTYCKEKRSFSFRFTSEILDPLVFDSHVHGIFFVNGHYASGTHMRAGDIARGGLRLLRVNHSNYSRELDGAVLLNYALGPKAQRLKHKDICESGSKGVVVPYPIYARCSKDALLDYTEGILDLMLLEGNSIVDYLGSTEMIFFGPDEGTAPLMDMVAERARERGYKYWRTMTTGKSIGIPHDTYGLLEDGRCFGLFGEGRDKTELQIDGKTVVDTDDMEEIYKEIGDKVAISGMTTTSVMSTFRTVIDYSKAKEEDLNLAITGGPDGDLGANEIQCYKGKICLIIDGGSILFDPEGLDKKELRKLAFHRNTHPRINSLGYPVEKLSKKGFMVPLRGEKITLPDGTFIEEGALFHRNFLTDPANRKYIQEANIQAFIPCGGFKDTINQGNVRDFLNNFAELKFIVEGANVFFSDGARRQIYAQGIKHMKDSSCNKGGVFSSSIAEVLTAFLLGNDYDDMLLNNKENMWSLVRDVMTLVARYASQEALMLLKLNERDKETPLFSFSEISSEDIFALQDKLEANIDTLLAEKEIVEAVLTEYIPPILVEKIGMEKILDTLAMPELQSYRNTILTKKTASMAYYKFGSEWDTFVAKFDKNMVTALKSVIK